MCTPVSGSLITNYFKAQYDYLNFTINYEDNETLADSEARFINHPNHQAISLELRELLWTALTRPQTQLMARANGFTLRD